MAKLVSYRHTFINSIGTFLSRVLGILKWTVVNHLFGKEADPFQASFNQINNLRKIIGEGSMNNAFIPVFQKVRAGGEQEEAANRFASSVINLFVLITMALSVLGILLAPWYVPWYVPGFKGPKLAEAIRMMQIMMPFTLFISLFSMAMGILNSHKKFTASAFAPLLFNVATTLIPVFMYKKWNMNGLAISVVIGGFLMFALEIVELVQIKFRYRFILEWNTPAMREFFPLLGRTMLNMSLLMVLSFIFTRYMSYLPDGSLTVQRNAFVINQAMVGVTGVALSTVLLPVLSSIDLRSQSDRFQQAVKEGFAILLWLLVPMSLFFILYPEVGVNIVYRDLQVLFTGNAGKYSDDLLQATYSATALYSLALLPMALNITLARIFYSVKDARTPLLINLLLLVGSTALYHLSRLRGWGLSGVIWADNIAGWLTSAYYLIRLRRLVSLGPVMRHFLGRLLLYGVLAGAVLGALYPFMRFVYQVQQNTLLKLLLGGTSFILFTAGYFSLTQWFKVGYKK